MDNKKIDAESVSFSEIFRKISEKHIVPTLQRPYVWKDKKHVKKFLDDIQENSNNYFIGSLVFVSAKQGTIGREEIIDGQQRIITISLILISIRSIIEEFNMKKRLESILREINSFLRYIDSYDEKEIIRLKFSDENTDQFFGKLLNNSTEKPLTETQKRLKGNHQYIIKKLKKILLSKKGDALSVLSVEKYFDKIKTLQAIGIKCIDNTVAYELFESINATGLSLASVDLIKNYVFKQSKKKGNLGEVEKVWQKIEELFSENRSLLKTYLRHQWISDGQYVSHAGLYGAVEEKHKKGNLETNKYVKCLLNEAGIYLSLKGASVEALSKINQGVRFDIKNVKEVLEFLSFLNVEQVYAPILFFYKNTDKNSFKKYLNKLAAFQFLYKYIPGSPSSAEKIFADFSKNGKSGFDEGFQNLYKLVEKSKETFKDNFLEKALYKGDKNGDMQFILERYVISKGGPLSFKEPTIEHIISQNVSKDQFFQKIGNLTIFEKKINSKLPAEFKEKIPHYRKSLYSEHCEILDKYDFDKDFKKSINRRKEDIADSLYDIFMNILKTGKLK